MPIHLEKNSEINEKECLKSIPVFPKELSIKFRLVCFEGFGQEQKQPNLCFTPWQDKPESCKKLGFTSP